MTPDEERRLAAEVADLQAQVALLSQDLTDLALVSDPRTGSRSNARLFPSVEEWVEGYFVPVFRRPLGGEFRWCTQWLDHAEARERLDALWRSWEALRVDEPAGMATWLTSLLDPQLPILMGRAGPFASCTPTRHEANLPRRLPTPSIDTAVASGPLTAAEVARSAS